MTATLATAYRSVRWNVTAITGEAKRDEYLAACAGDGIEPMSRRQVEREPPTAVNITPSRAVAEVDNGAPQGPDERPE